MGECICPRCPRCGGLVREVARPLAPISPFPVWPTYPGVPAFPPTFPIYPTTAPDGGPFWEVLPHTYCGELPGFANGGVFSVSGEQ